MKTKFFKKLSFVLVVAMVLSVFAPAAGVFAAKAPKLNSTKKYLHLDVDKLNEFNFNISNKGKGWKYYWETADEEVAVVNEKNGVVTATGVGTTKVTCYITDKDGEEITDLTATVVVRDNIKTVKITNVPEDNKLAVDEANDFNRSFETVSGSKKKTSAITRWTVEPAEGATIDEKGVFVATEAGKYTVTALSFQSKARYEAWLDDAETYKDYVLATDSVEITVAASMVEAKQVDLEKFNVKFDSAMDEDDVKENLKVSLLVGEVKSPQYVKSVALDEEDASVAVVEMYGPFAKGMTYVAEYEGMEDVSFKAASTNYTDVVRMTIDTKSVVAGKEEDIEFTLYNADNVDITDGTDADFGGLLRDRVSFDTESTGAYVHSHKITIFEVGTVADVKATYNTLQYDEQGKEIGTVYAVAQIVGAKEASVPAGSLSKWTITTGTDNPNWDKLNTRVAVSATTPKLHAEVKKTNGDPVKSTEDANFVFESTNDNKLYVTPNGDLYPISEGTVVVIIKYDDTIVGYASVSVVPESKAVALTLSEYVFTLSTDSEFNDSKEISVTLKDQYEGDATVTKSDIKPLDTANSVAEHITATITGKKINFVVKPGATTGKAVYEVMFNDLKRTVTVTLAAPNDTEASQIRYRLDLDKSIDLVIKEAADLTKTLNIGLVGYAPNGVKTTPNVATGATITITGPQNDLVNGQLLYGRADDDTNAITKFKTGTYKVVAKIGDTVVDTQYFTVSDTQKAATLTKVKETFYTEGTLNAIAAECFEIKIDGKDHNGVLDVETIGPDTVGGPIYIKEVKVKQAFGSDYIVHTVKVGMTVRPAQ